MVKFNDLRQWIDQIGAMGELKEVSGADWNLEIGAITDLMRREQNSPAVLFDDIKDYPKGYRILVNPMQTLSRSAYTLGLPLGKEKREYVDLWWDKYQSIQPIPPKELEHGPITENVLTGNAVNCWKFPAPLWHEKDGGRYIGTADAVITRDPEDGWVNLGVYRVMIKDERTIFVYISPGHHGRIMRDKYFARGESCPVAISCGHDPLFWIMSAQSMQYGVSEYDITGGVMGRPVEVIRGAHTGLPIPANAEIVFEGFISPTEQAPEGPFGEWTGYYASGVRDEYLLNVTAIYHRNDPIILGSPPGRPPYAKSTAISNCLISAKLKKTLREAGVPDVKDVWCHEFGGNRFFTVVSIRQRFSGHARQAAMIATAFQYMGRYVVVVDDDIDVYDIHDVMWAICTRSNPATDIEILHRAWSGPLDPIIPPGQKGHNTRAIIDATRPWEWRDQFPSVVDVSPALRDQVQKKWRGILFK